MTAIQFIGSLLFFLFGWMIFAGAKSAIHESVASSFVVAAAVLFAGAAITYTINKLSRQLAGLAEDAAPKPPVTRPAPEPTIDDQPLPVIPQPAPERRDQPPPARSWVDDAREQLQKEKGATS